MIRSVFLVTSRLVWEEVLHLFFYPVWWYSNGLFGLARWAQEGLRYRARKYAIGLWMHHLSTPMYGEYSLIGRMVSVVMRLVVIIARSVAWVVEALVYTLLLVLWIAWPPLLILGVLFLCPAFFRA